MISLIWHKSLFILLLKTPRLLLLDLMSLVVVQIFHWFWSLTLQYSTMNLFPLREWLYQLRNFLCCNLSLGLATKARACEGAGQEWSLGVTFHVPKSVGECEGMNPHTPKWAPTLGIGVPMESRWSPNGVPMESQWSLELQREISGVKIHWIK